MASTACGSADCRSRPNMAWVSLMRHSTPERLLQISTTDTKAEPGASRIGAFRRGGALRVVPISRPTALLCLRGAPKNADSPPRGPEPSRRPSDKPSAAGADLQPQLLRLGHLRRCRAIAQSLVAYRDDLSILMISGLADRRGSASRRMSTSSACPASRSSATRATSRTAPACRSRT